MLGLDDELALGETDSDSDWLADSLADVEEPGEGDSDTDGLGLSVTDGLTLSDIPEGR